MRIAIVSERDEVLFSKVPERSDSSRAAAVKLVGEGGESLC